MKHLKFSSFLITLFLITGTLLGCSGKPSKGIAEDLIKKHYESQGYKVVEMEIGDIKPEALGGYWVSVILTIESTKDAGFPFFIKKGQRITNKNHYVAIANFRGGSAIIRK